MADNPMLEYDLILAEPDIAADRMIVAIVDGGSSVRIQCASEDAESSGGGYADVVVMHANKPVVAPKFAVKQEKHSAEVSIASFDSSHSGTYECYAVSTSAAGAPPMKRALLKLAMKNKNSALPPGYIPCEGDMKTSYCQNGGICFKVPPVNSAHCYCANTGFSGQLCQEPYNIALDRATECKYKPELMLSLPLLNVALAIILAVLVVLLLIERFRGKGRSVNSLPASPATPFFPVYVCSQCQVAKFGKKPPPATVNNGFLTHATSYDETARPTKRGMSDVSTISKDLTESLLVGLKGSNGSSLSDHDGSNDTLQRQFKRSRKLAISETHLDDPTA